MMIGLMLDGMPIRHIARMLGIDPKTVRIAKRHMTEEQAAALAVISARHRTLSSTYSNRPGGRPKRSAEPRPPVTSDPALVAALVDGRSYLDISTRLGFAKSTIARAVHKLTPEQAAQREARMLASRIRTSVGWAPKRDRSTGRFGSKPATVEPEPEPTEWRIAA